MEKLEIYFKIKKGGYRLLQQKRPEGKTRNAEDSSKCHEGSVNKEYRKEKYCRETHRFIRHGKRERVRGKDEVRNNFTECLHGGNNYAKARRKDAEDGNSKVLRGEIKK